MSKPQIEVEAELEAIEGEQQEGSPRTIVSPGPLAGSPWVTPGLAAFVVAAVALVLLGVVGLAIWELKPGRGSPPAADPNAGTIAALASAGIAALTSLAAAYFGIKVATEQSAQSAATTARAIHYLGNSTPNGNPVEADF